MEIPRYEGSIIDHMFANTAQKTKLSNVILSPINTDCLAINEDVSTFLPAKLEEKI